jgi:hypothetical protein
VFTARYELNLCLYFRFICGGQTGEAWALSEMGEHWIGNYFHFFLVFKGLISIVCPFADGTV